ncbi:porin family protein [Sphingobium sp. CR2-8]|uniref:outer membrane protein n=1 Tax=Sphingobium sp. CR2-8 TaxID=1306534 RepID=UPI002DB63D4C|nr:porin family protein [Sphingobium sp. CR2-8]MEC3910757.1 porin family protein [Sphingobium sp. CR2-8]
MIRYLLPAVCAAGVFATQAHAQEAGNFGGFKLGVVAGYDKVSLEYEDVSASDDGVLYGVTAGYDLDLGNAVIGLELEASDSSAKQRFTDLIFSGDRAKLATGRDLYVGARIGIPVSPNLLIYAKGGYVNGRVKLTYDGGAALILTDSDTLDGWRLGGGLELTNPTHFARIEYRYSDYGSYKIAGVDTGIDVTRQQVAVTGGFRF